MSEAALASVVRAAFARRDEPLRGLRAQATALADAAEALAERLSRGGRLLVAGTGAATTDALHVAVEFLHPAVVGRRPLPALSLAADGATVLGVAEDEGLEEVWAHQLRALARPEDVLVLLSPGGAATRALAEAQRLGILTLGLGGPPGTDCTLRLEEPDPLLRKEIRVSAYHLLWELVHLFLDLPEGGDGAGDLAALYPMVYGGAADAESARHEAADLVRSKVEELLRLREEVAAGHAEALACCAAAVAERVAAGGTLLAFGNGGSATDAQDVAQAFLRPPWGRPVPALALVNDVAVVTALANDVGFEVVFARQLASLGRPGDVAVALSTSGGSANVAAGLAQAKRAGMLTVGLAGGGGGRMAQAGAVDHLLVVPSASVHRVQEVQTTVVHALREAVSHALGDAPPPPPPARG